jgi:COP9 signalosome complex subunit 3
LTLSLADIAAAVELPSAKEAEMHVLHMIEDRDIHATINQKDGMVSFLEDPEQYHSVSMIQRLDAEVQNMMLLARKVAMVDEQVRAFCLFIIRMREKKGER